MKKATFVVPLGKGSGWENNELRYMIRSLEAHCQFDFDIVLFCTEKIEWLDCKQIIVDRTYPLKVKSHFAGKEHYECYYDVLNKLRVMIEHEDVPEEFFYIYDDILLLEDLYLADMRKIYAGNHYDRNPIFFDNPKNKWTRTLHAALQLCKDNSFPMYIYETHLPRYYKKSYLREMFKRFVPENNYIPYAPSTVYYNMFYKKPDHNYIDNNYVKAAFYGGTIKNESSNSKSTKEIEDAVNNKLWCNYNNAGLTGTLKMWIECKFSTPSKFEK